MGSNPSTRKGRHGDGRARAHSHPSEPVSVTSDPIASRFIGWWEGFENHRGEPSAGQTELEPKYGSYGYAPADSRESLSLPGSGVREERGREGGVRRRFGEVPPWVESPVTLCIPA